MAGQWLADWSTLDTTKNLWQDPLKTVGPVPLGSVPLLRARHVPGLPSRSLGIHQRDWTGTVNFLIHHRLSLDVLALDQTLSLGTFANWIHRSSFSPARFVLRRCEEHC